MMSFEARVQAFIERNGGIHSKSGDKTKLIVPKYENRRKKLDYLGCEKMPIRSTGKPKHRLTKVQQLKSLGFQFDKKPSNKKVVNEPIETFGQRLSRLQTVHPASLKYPIIPDGLSIERKLALLGLRSDLPPEESNFEEDLRSQSDAERLDYVSGIKNHTARERISQGLIVLALITTAAFANVKDIFKVNNLDHSPVPIFEPANTYSQISDDVNERVDPVHFEKPVFLRAEKLLPDPTAPNEVRKDPKLTERGTVYIRSN